MLPPTLYRLSLLFLVFSVMAGCSRKKELDLLTVTDRQIEEEFLLRYEQTGAIKFLEKGGCFVDSEDRNEEKMDKLNVLPLLKDLEDKFGFDWIALTDPKFKKDAMQIIAKIPPGVSRYAVNEYLIEVQKTFPGDILQGWGNKWFSIDFLNQEETQMLKELESQIVE